MPEERNALGAGVANRLDFAFDAALAEAARHQDAVVAGQQPLRPFGFDVLAVNAADADLRAVGDAGVIERFVDRLVRVVVLGVLADDGDADFVLRIAQPAQQLAPIVEVGLRRLQAELVDDQPIELVVDQAQRHFVDRKVLVLLFDHRVDRDVAEQGDLLAVVAAERLLGAADEDVRLDTDLPELADRVLRRLGLQLAGRLQVRHEREMDVEAVLLADVERELADGFQERQAFDVAHRAADLGDHDVDVPVASSASLAITLLISLVMCGITCTVLPRNSPRRSLLITDR